MQPAVLVDVLWQHNMTSMAAPPSGHFNVMGQPACYPPLTTLCQRLGLRSGVGSRKKEDIVKSILNAQAPWLQRVQQQ